MGARAAGNTGAVLTHGTAPHHRAALATLVFAAAVLLSAQRAVAQDLTYADLIAKVGAGAGSGAAQGPPSAVTTPAGGASSAGATAAGSPPATGTAVQPPQPPPSTLGYVDPLAGALPSDALLRVGGGGVPQTTVVQIPSGVGAAEARDPPPQAQVALGVDPQTAALQRVEATAQAQLGIYTPGSRMALPPDVAALSAFSASISNLLALQGQGLRGWGGSSNPCSGWTGVTCDAAGQVIGIDLGGWLVKAQLGPALTGLDHLVNLNLSSCQLTGPLPPSWGNASVWANLTALDLSRNPGIGGGLPPEWGDPAAFQSLATLAVRGAGLVGGLPLAWGATGALVKLAVLDLSNNQLAGGLPDEWATPGAMPKLQQLRLSNNTLTGGLPLSWGATNVSMASLGVLDLADNQLTGQLPDVWGPGMPALVELHLQNNAFVGPMPATWGSVLAWRSLGWLDLHGNQLTGPVPPAWTPATALHKLHALVLKPGNPGLCGPFPPRIAALAFTSDWTPVPSSTLPLCTPIPPALAPPPAGILAAAAGAAGAPVGSARALAPAGVAIAAAGAALPPAGVALPGTPTTTAWLPSAAGALPTATALPAAAAPPPTAAGVVLPANPAVPDGGAASAVNLNDDSLFGGSVGVGDVTKPSPTPTATLAAALIATPAAVIPPRTVVDVATTKATAPVAGPHKAAASPRHAPGPAGAAHGAAHGPAGAFDASDAVLPGAGPASIPAPTPRPLFKPAPGPYPDGIVPAYLQVQYNLTGFGLLPASTRTRKTVQGALRKALGEDFNATLLQMADNSADEEADDASTSPDGTAAASDDDAFRGGAGTATTLAAPATADDGSARADPSAVSANNPLLSGRRRLAGLVRSLLAATGAAGIGNAPRDPSLMTPEEVAAAAAAQASAAASHFDLSALDGSGGFGSNPGQVDVNGNPIEKVTKDWVQTTFLITTTPSELLSVADKVNSTDITRKFTRELVKEGFEGTKAKLADIKIVQADGSVAPIPAPAPPPPSPPTPAAWNFVYDPNAFGGYGSGDAGPDAPKLFGFWPSSLGAFVATFVILGLVLITAVGGLYYFCCFKGRANKSGKAGKAAAPVAPTPQAKLAEKGQGSHHTDFDPDGSSEDLGKDADEVRANDSANSLVKDAGSKVVVIEGISPDPSDLTSSPSTPEGSLTESDIKPIIPTKSSKVMRSGDGAIQRTRSGGGDRELRELRTRASGTAIVPRSTADRPRSYRPASNVVPRGGEYSLERGLERTRGSSGSGGTNLERLAREMQAFEQDLARQEHMIRAGSGSVRHVDFDGGMTESFGHSRRNSSREDLTLGPRGLARGPSRGYAPGGRDINEDRLRSLERELGLRPDPDPLSHARPMLLDDMDGGRVMGDVGMGSGLARSRSGMSNGSGRGGSDKSKRGSRSPQ